MDERSKKPRKEASFRLHSSSEGRELEKARQVKVRRLSRDQWVVPQTLAGVPRKGATFRCGRSDDYLGGYAKSLVVGLVVVVFF